LIAYMMYDAASWNFSAKVVPMVVGTLGLFFGTLSLLNQLVHRPELRPVPTEGAGGPRLHMDLQTDHSALTVRETIRRAGVFFTWLLLFMASMAFMGLIPTVPLFVVAFMRLENREPWKIVAPMAILLAIFIYIVFDQLLTIPWPPTYLGGRAPLLKQYIPSI
jgi:hypothetical protein